MTKARFRKMFLWHFWSNRSTHLTILYAFMCLFCTVTSVARKVGETVTITDEDKANFGTSVQHPHASIIFAHVECRFSAETMKQTIKKSTQAPQKKTPFPMTANQEIGWDWELSQETSGDAPGIKDKHFKPKSSCDETKVSSLVQLLHMHIRTQLYVCFCVRQLTCNCVQFARAYISMTGLTPYQKKL